MFLSALAERGQELLMMGKPLERGVHAAVRSAAREDGQTVWRGQRECIGKSRVTEDGDFVLKRTRIQRFRGRKIINLHLLKLACFPPYIVPK